VLPTTTAARPLSLDETSDEQLAELLAGQLSPHTERAYRTDLRRFFEWATEQPAPRLLDKAFVVLYRAHLAGSYAPATVNRRLTTLRVLCAELVERGHIDRNPLGRLRGMRLTNESPLATLTRAQCADLLEATCLDSTPRGWRDRAVLQLGLWTGMRKTELRSATWQDLTRERQHRVLWFTGKRRVRRRTKIHPALGSTLDVWRTWLSRCLKVEVCDLKGPLFRAVYGPRTRLPDDGSWPWTSTETALSDTALDNLVRRWCAAARVPHLTPHSLRATHITLARLSGAPTHLVQHNAGHADPRTTDRYDAQRRNLDHHATDYLSFLGGADADEPSDVHPDATEQAEGVD